MDGDYYEAMIDKSQWGEFGQDTGDTPLLFTRSALGFLMTTESQEQMDMLNHVYPCYHFIQCEMAKWCVQNKMMHKECRLYKTRNCNA